MGSLKIKFFVVCLGVLQLGQLFAQCPMCKAAAESNLKEGGTAALGLNNGIFYLLFSPFILVFVIGLLWYFNSRSSAIEEQITTS